MKKLIKMVETGSIGEELGIEAGDFLVSINDAQIRDIFDYRMMTAHNDLEVLIQKQDGEEWQISVEKEDDEDLGFVFDNGLMDEVNQCANNCVFCFIEQNPKKIMRDTIYFKDDDYRLSFLHGNYVTLTNIGQADVDRILRLRLSPVNVSVHTTNKTLRVEMMGNGRAGESLKYLKQLAEGGIVLGLQIVLCKGYNDGAELDKTISDLGLLAKHSQGGFSLSVVPAGLTRHRQGLPRIDHLSREDCRAVIKQVEGRQDGFLRELGTRFVYCSDEFYVKGGLGLPKYDTYEDFPQIENGVGMLASFRYDFEQINQMFHVEHQKITIVTGLAAYEFMRALSLPPQISIKVVRNEFFGENVTVAGLLTGQDIINQLKGQELGDLVLLPKCCLRFEQDVFLDNVGLEDVARELGVKVLAVEADAEGLLSGIKGLTYG